MTGTWHLTGFNTLEFVLVFLPVIVAAHWAILRRFGAAGGVAILLAASVAFYGLSSPSTLPVLAGSLLFNFSWVRRVTSGASQVLRKRYLTLGVCANVGLLAVVKYSRFFAEIIATLTPWHPSVPAFVLPLGISFFTLQQIIYLIDAYEGLAAPAPLALHALFISFFPYVSAGPIVHAEAVLPQLSDPGRVTDDRVARGLVRFILGLVKKAVLAELLGRAVDAGFADHAATTLVDSWTAALSYAFQVYFDFSGYTDMAVGAALMLGVVLPENFERPFAATSIIDFWKRWHMTLTAFISTYLYTPIARSMLPLTFRKAMVSTVLAMTIAGLWHGAAWTYVLFGLLHGAALVVNNVWRKTKRKLPRPLAWALTFSFLVTSFVLFRAPSLSDAADVYAGMLGLHRWALSDLLNAHGFLSLATSLAPVAVGIALLRAPTSGEFAAELRPSRRHVIAFSVALVICLAFLNSGTNKGFIYREF